MTEANTEAVPPTEPKKTSKRKAPKKPVKKPNKAPKKAAVKAEDKPKVRWGSLMSIDSDELAKALKGEKNAMSAKGIAKKFKCTIWTAKRSVLRLSESKGIAIQTISRQEGKAGVPSACYFIK